MRISCDLVVVYLRRERNAPAQPLIGLGVSASGSDGKPGETHPGIVNTLHFDIFP